MIDFAIVGAWVPLGIVLEWIGLNLGKRPITLLSFIAFTVNAPAFYALVLLLIRFVGL